MNASRDYRIAPGIADDLRGVSLLPAEFRRKWIAKYAKDHGNAALIDLFAEFIGLANSVVKNAREAVEMILICTGNMHPHEAEKANIPTIYGALSGVILAAGQDQEKACSGCAFRLGTCANQSPSTTLDALGCIDDSGQFWCHENLDDQGNPTQKCVGFQRRLRTRPT